MLVTPCRGLSKPAWLYYSSVVFLGHLPKFVFAVSSVGFPQVPSRPKQKVSLGSGIRRVTRQEIPPPKKLKRELPNEKIGHELFEQATNEYAPVSHMTLPWLSWILSPFSCIQSFLINLTCTFFVSSLPFVAVTFNLDHCLYFCSVLNLEETAGYFLSIISTGGTLFLPRCHDLI